MVSGGCRRRTHTAYEDGAQDESREAARRERFKPRITGVELHDKRERDTPMWLYMLGEILSD